MDFNTTAANVSASFILILRRSIELIVTPYKTMRKISLETDFTQVYIILTILFIYFQIAYRLKEYNYQPLRAFLFLLVNGAATILFFYIFARIFKKAVTITPFIFTFIYSLIPTFIWFVTNSAFYYLLPPPRTVSILGKAFSLFFLSFSISLLLWKLILFYLFARFSTKLPFFTLVFLICLYIAVIIPYSLMLYRLSIFRIPFL